MTEFAAAAAVVGAVAVSDDGQTRFAIKSPVRIKPFSTTTNIRLKHTRARTRGDSERIYTTVLLNLRNYKNIVSR